jgi:TrmH family RNA methyltransferase
VAERCEELRAPVTALPDNLFNAVSQVEHGVHLIFVVPTPRPGEAPALTTSSVLLDGVQDPGNVGSILRSAAASGVKQVVCSPGTAFCWSPKVLRAAMGAHFVLDIFENVELAPLVRASRVPVLATSGYAAEQLYDIDLKRDVAWVLGHEGQGVSPELLELATHRVAVPHAGLVESLNVAACAAVCFFEQLRQRRA